MVPLCGFPPHLAPLTINAIPCKNFRFVQTVLTSGRTWPTMVAHSRFLQTALMSGRTWPTMVAFWGRPVSPQISFDTVGHETDKSLHAHNPVLCSPCLSLLSDCWFDFRGDHQSMYSARTRVSPSLGFGLIFTRTESESRILIPTSLWIPYVSYATPKCKPFFCNKMLVGNRCFFPETFQAQNWSGMRICSLKRLSRSADREPHLLPGKSEKKMQDLNQKG